MSDRILYRGHYLGLITLAWTFLTTGLLPPSGRLGLHIQFLSFTTFVALIETLLLAGETLLAVLMLGDYSYSFQLNWKPGLTRRMAELKWFTLRLYRVWLAGVTTIYVWHLHWRVLTGPVLIPAAVGFPGSCLRLALQCGYFTEVTMATVGFGDIQPANGLGQLVTFVIILCSFCWVTVTFAAIVTVRERR
jgi:hypothetical protein